MVFLVIFYCFIGLLYNIDLIYSAKGYNSASPEHANRNITYFSLNVIAPFNGKENNTTQIPNIQGLVNRRNQNNSHSLIKSKEIAITNAIRSYAINSFKILIVMVPANIIFPYDYFW